MTKRRRRTNAQLLRDWIYLSPFERLGVPHCKADISGMQSTAELLQREFAALSAGKGECPKHPGCVDTACMRCEHIWPFNPIPLTWEHRKERRKANKRLGLDEHDGGPTS